MQYIQCVGRGDPEVLHYAIDIFIALIEWRDIYANV